MRFSSMLRPVRVPSNLRPAVRVLKKGLDDPGLEKEEKTMEPLKTTFSTVSSSNEQFDDIWLWIIIFFLVSGDFSRQKEKQRRKKQQRHFELISQPKRPRSRGPKIF
jgi:hypothetical protein